MEFQVRTTPCPKCSTAMESIKLAGVVIDSCPFCQGCWLDGKELERITRSRGSEAVRVNLSDPRPSELKCPRCRGTVLQQDSHSTKTDLVLDQCQTCGGLWLDQGELPRLLARD